MPYMSKVATTSEPEPKPGKSVDSLKIQYHNNPSITPVINATIVMLQYILLSQQIEVDHTNLMWIASVALIRIHS